MARLLILSMMTLVGIAVAAPTKSLLEKNEGTVQSCQAGSVQTTNSSRLIQRVLCVVGKLHTLEYKTVGVSSGTGSKNDKTRC